MGFALRTSMPPPPPPRGLRALLVVPKNVVNNWRAEVVRWLDPLGGGLSSKHLYMAGTTAAQADDAVRQWHAAAEGGGFGAVLVMSMDQYKTRVSVSASASAQVPQPKSAAVSALPLSPPGAAKGTGAAGRKAGGTAGGKAGGKAGGVACRERVVEVLRRCGAPGATTMQLRDALLAQYPDVYAGLNSKKLYDMAWINSLFHSSFEIRPMDAAHKAAGHKGTAREPHTHAFTEQKAPC